MIKSILWLGLRLILLLLLIPFLLVKANRGWRPWMVLVPVGTIFIILFFLGFIPPLRDSKGFSLFSQVIGSFAIGLGVLWLLLYKLAGFRRVVSFFLTIGILTGIGLIVVVCTTLLDISDETAAFMTLYGFGMVIISAGLGMTHFLARENYSPFIFSLSLFAGYVILSVVSIVVFFSIIAFTNESVVFSKEILSVILIGGAIGIIGFVILLPFMILTFNNSVYHTRFQSVFGVGEKINLQEK